MTILGWQNSDDGVIPKQESPSLRASGGTDIRKRPMVYDDYNGAFTEEVGAVRQNFGHEAGGNGVKIVRMDDNESIEHRVYGPEGIAPTLPTGATGGNLIPKVVGHTRAREKDVNGQIAISYHEKGEVGTLKNPSGNQSDFLKFNGRIRRLTPIECERLQGFPDGWTAGVSDTQRYRMMGNAVTVNVVQAIGKAILEAVSEQ